MTNETSNFPFKDPYNEVKQLNYFRGKSVKTLDEEFYYQMLEYLNTSGRLNNSGTKWVSYGLN